MRRVETGRTRTKPARPGRCGQRSSTRLAVFGSVVRNTSFDAVLFPQDLDRALVLAEAPAPVGERVLEARDGLRGEDAEGAERPARVEEALLPVERVRCNEPMELVRDIADERRFLSNRARSGSSSTASKKAALRATAMRLSSPSRAGWKRTSVPGACGETSFAKSSPFVVSDRNAGSNPK